MTADSGEAGEMALMLNHTVRPGTSRQGTSRKFMLLKIVSPERWGMSVDREVRTDAAAWVSRPGVSVEDGRRHGQMGLQSKGEKHFGWYQREGEDIPEGKNIPTREVSELTEPKIAVTVVRPNSVRRDGQDATSKIRIRCRRDKDIVAWNFVDTIPKIQGAWASVCSGEPRVKFKRTIRKVPKRGRRKRAPVGSPVRNELSKVSDSREMGKNVGRREQAPVSESEA
ncbi:hypothetical protein DFH07DRAFT_947424 [Mycena maculata]|uniref:Uncharacterized protein n=1 Tax=Mycena maculata TaxID=230809 RepID=A0AAD7HD34_9AGAR|nr:hypothetical protein DFH07DRAFT_947424 [Mycena maculata]